MASQTDPWIRNDSIMTANRSSLPNTLIITRTLLSAGTERHDAADRLPVDPGDKVLDVCAAPAEKRLNWGETERQRNAGGNDLSNSALKPA